MREDIHEIGQKVLDKENHLDLINFRIKEVQRKIHQHDSLHREIERTNSRPIERVKSNPEETDKPNKELNALKAFLHARQAPKPLAKKDKIDQEVLKAGKLRVVR